MTLYEVIVSRVARKEPERLPILSAQRILLELRALQEQPRPQDCRKLIDQPASYRVRVGDYRIVYEVSDPEHKVLVTRIRHRKDAYQ